MTKRAKRFVAGTLSLALGAGAVCLAVGFYKTGTNLEPLAGGLRGQDYALFLTLGGLGLAFLTIAYVFLLQSPRA